MAQRAEENPGSWLLAEEFFERGDTAFVDEFRRLSATPEKIGGFAARWIADPRPAARALLFDYLDRPLDAFRHEAFVKRLYKLAEKAGDDSLMARFLVAFDRAIRRIRAKRRRWDPDDREVVTEEIVVAARNTTMPKDDRVYRYFAARKSNLRLFTPRTRKYLRRRTWRYFRELGKRDPDRYRTAAVEALGRYTDDDVADGVALLDNWGLVHLLFHHSPVLVGTANGWTLAEGRSLNELAPAPAFPGVWTSDAACVIAVLKGARCRPVRQWALQMLRGHHPGAVARLPIRELLALLDHEDADVSQLAADALRNSEHLGQLTADEWLGLLDTVNVQVLDLVCELVEKRLDPSAVSLEQRVRLACSRPLPVARQGFAWLQMSRPETEAELQALFPLAEAEAVPLRPELVRWLRGVLGSSPLFRTEWILDLLDSRHADVRGEGWAWFVAEPRAAHDVSLWQKLFETPYDDLRVHLIAMLEERAAGRENGPAWDRSRLNPDLVRWLWASVLLNIHRGSKTKPRIVRQIAARLQRHPEEAVQLLPILAMALRSVRGPEWQAGLAAVVQLAEQNPDLRETIEKQFAIGF